MYAFKLSTKGETSCGGLSPKNPLPKALDKRREKPGIEKTIRFLPRMTSCSFAAQAHISNRTLYHYYLYANGFTA